MSTTTDHLRLPWLAEWHRLLSLADDFLRLTMSGDDPINNILFHGDNPTIVFAPLSVTEVVNTLAAVELITVHYVCLEVFGRGRKD